MSKKAAAPRETFLALGAFVGLHPRVGSLVLNEVRPAAEGLPTVRALVGLLPCVDSLVFCKDRAVAEALPTLRTRIRFLSCVHALVYEEVGLPAEGPPALRTYVLVRSCLDFPGLRSIVRLREPFPKVRPDGGFPSHAFPLRHIEVQPQLEALAPF